MIRTSPASCKLNGWRTSQIYWHVACQAYVEELIVYTLSMPFGLSKSCGGILAASLQRRFSTSNQYLAQLKSIGKGERANAQIQQSLPKGLCMGLTQVADVR